MQTLTALAERLKQDLIAAIAAEQIVRPAASDNELISCFNVGRAGRAFDWVRHSVLFSLVLALTRLWDTRKDVHSIQALVRLLSDTRVVNRLVERERNATNEVGQVEVLAGEGKKELSFSAERWTSDLRERDLRARLDEWRKQVKSADCSGEICRLRNYRHEILAHSASWLHHPQKPFPSYSDEQRALERTIPIVSEGFRLATGIDYDFSTAISVWSSAQTDFWEIMRSAARGKRYSPPPLTLDDVIRDATEKGATSFTIRG